MNVHRVAGGVGTLELQPKAVSAITDLFPSLPLTGDKPPSFTAMAKRRACCVSILFHMQAPRRTTSQRNRMFGRASTTPHGVLASDARRGLRQMSPIITFVLLAGALGKRRQVGTWRDL
jgi:hypothetical protein